MERAYHIVKYRLDDADRYLLCYYDDPDGVVMDEERRVLSFADRALLRSWAHGNGISIERGTLERCDLDNLRQWSASPDPDAVDCVAILYAWNLFIDIRSSFEQRDVIRDDPQNDDLYEKIFWGNNLPSVTPKGKCYVPIWSEQEARRIAVVMDDGVRFFRAHIRHIDRE